MKSGNIFLIGMMGAGKSTVGKLLANNNISFLDIDDELEKITDMSIIDMFNYYGYDRFRLMESAFFKECSKLNQFIVSTGGGIVEYKDNQGILKNNGFCIFLDCSLEELKKRIKNDTKQRPLLQKNSNSTIDKIYNYRYTLYKACSHLTINVNNKTPEQIVLQINKHLNA